jgi:tetratricopeptide (TPR) repeat protein
VLSASSLRVLTVAACLLAGPALRAAEPAAIPHAVDDEVGRHATLGQRHLEHGRYQEAIAEFRRAYELRADPRFLFDIAEAYRQMGIVERALFFYDRYLAGLPDAPDRDEVESKMAELEEARTRAVPLTAPAPSLDRDVVIVPVFPRAEHRRRASPPLWRHWWFWVALGAAATAAAIAAAAASARDQATVPSTELGDKRFY